MPALQSRMQSSASATSRHPAVAGYRSRAGRISGIQRLRRIALVVSMVALMPAFSSYLGAMTQTSNSPFGIRTVEWLRDHGAAGLVAKVESIYYGFTAPSKGGPTLKKLPNVGYGATGAAPGSLEYRPASVPALLRPALPGEGVWRPTRPSLQQRTAGARDNAARPTGIPARVRRPRMDRHQTHDDRSQPGSSGAVGRSATRTDAGADREPSAAAGDVQQRLQAVRLARWLRLGRAHVRNDARWPGHDRRVHQRRRRSDRLDLWPHGSARTCRSRARICL